MPGAVPGILAFPVRTASRMSTPPRISTAMNKIGKLPWALTFSYGRALQARAAKPLGAARADNVAAAQAAFAHPCADEQVNAALGKWIECDRDEKAA